MKEELKVLKDSTLQILKAKENLKKQTTFFNMKVEEKVNEKNIDEVFNDNNNSYDAAKALNECLPNIHLIVSKLRNQHPKYGNKRIKELALNEFIAEDIFFAELNEEAELLLDNYFLYEDCGFFKLREQELSIEALLSETKCATEAIITESKQTAVKVGTSIKNVVKPYGDVAKSQLNDAGITAKKVVNKGSKKLIHVLKKIENKTENN